MDPFHTPTCYFFKICAKFNPLNVTNEKTRLEICAMFALNIFNVSVNNEACSFVELLFGMEMEFSRRFDF
jgi:hypothetical protein